MQSCDAQDPRVTKRVRPTVLRAFLTASPSQLLIVAVWWPILVLLGLRLQIAPWWAVLPLSGLLVCLLHALLIWGTLTFQIGVRPGDLWRIEQDDDATAVVLTQPRGGHTRLTMMAAHPKGHGLASDLLADVLDRSRRAGQPTRLQAIGKNIGWYRARGLQVTARTPIIARMNDATVQPARTSTLASGLSVCSAMAVALSALAYWVAFGQTIALPQSNTPPPDPPDLVSFIVTALYLITALAAAAVSATLLTPRTPQTSLREWALGRPDPTRGSGASSAGWWLAALLAGLVPYLVVTQLWEIPTTTTGPHAPVWFGIWWAVYAGVGEELVVMALPYLVLRHLLDLRPGHQPGRWAITLTLLVALRLAFHLYYGWGVLAFLPWAVAVPLIYVTYGRVWPLIAAHIGFNLLALLRAHSALGESGQLLLATGVCVALLIVGRHRVTATTAPQPVHQASTEAHRPDRR